MQTNTQLSESIDTMNNVEHTPFVSDLHDGQLINNVYIWTSMGINYKYTYSIKYKKDSNIIDSIGGSLEIHDSETINIITLSVGDINTANLKLNKLNIPVTLKK